MSEPCLFCGKKTCLLNERYCSEACVEVAQRAREVCSLCQTSCPTIALPDQPFCRPCKMIVDQSRIEFHDKFTQDSVCTTSHKTPDQASPETESKLVQHQDGEKKQSLALPDAAWTCLICTTENVSNSSHCKVCLTVCHIPLPSQAKNAPRDKGPTCLQCKQGHRKLFGDLCKVCSVRLDLPWSSRRRRLPPQAVPAVKKTSAQTTPTDEVKLVQHQEEKQRMLPPQTVPAASKADALKCKAHLEQIAKNTKYLAYQALKLWRTLTSTPSVPIHTLIDWYCKQPDIECLQPTMQHDLVRKIMMNAAGMQETVNLPAFTLFMQRFGPLDDSFVKMAVLCQSDGTKQPWWNPYPGATIPKTHVTKFLAKQKQLCNENIGWYIEPHRKPLKYPGGFSLIYQAKSELGFAEYVIFNDIAGLFCRDDAKPLFYRNLVAALNYTAKYSFIGFSKHQLYKHHCTWPQQLYSTTQQSGCLFMGDETEKAWERENNFKNQLLQAQAQQKLQKCGIQTCDKGVQTDTVATLSDPTCVPTENKAVPMAGFEKLT